MTLQATWNDRAIEICDTIAVPRAVYPTKFSPVRNRQLKKLVPFPEQVCLPLPSGPNYEVKPLSAFRGVWRNPLHRGLEETVFLFIHPEQ
jgi:hypothetical protein